MSLVWHSFTETSKTFWAQPRIVIRSSRTSGIQCGACVHFEACGPRKHFEIECHRSDFFCACSPTNMPRECLPQIQACPYLYTRLTGKVVFDSKSVPPFPANSHPLLVGLVFFSRFPPSFADIHTFSVRSFVTRPLPCSCCPKLKKIGFVRWPRLIPSPVPLPAHSETFFANPHENLVLQRSMVPSLAPAPSLLRAYRARQMPSQHFKHHRQCHLYLSTLSWRQHMRHAIRVKTIKASHVMRTHLDWLLCFVLGNFKDCRSDGPYVLLSQRFRQICEQELELTSLISFRSNPIFPL